MPTEQSFQKRILDWLKSQSDIFAFKVISANIAGIPDIIVVIKGQFLAVEVKRESGITSSIQHYTHGLIKKAGGQVIVVKPSEFESLKQLVRNIKENCS